MKRSTGIEKPVGFYLDRLAAERKGKVAAASLGKAMGIGGWTSLGIGAAGAVAAVVFYFTGADAYRRYGTATDPDAATALHDQIVNSSRLFYAGLGVGATGLALSPVLLFTRPDSAKAEAAVLDIDRKIAELNKDVAQ